MTEMTRRGWLTTLAALVTGWAAGLVSRLGPGAAPAPVVGTTSLRPSLRITPEMHRALTTPLGRLNLDRTYREYRQWVAGWRMADEMRPMPAGLEAIWSTANERPSPLLQVCAESPTAQAIERALRLKDPDTHIALRYLKEWDIKANTG